MRMQLLKRIEQLSASQRRTRRRVIIGAAAALSAASGVVALLQAKPLISRLGGLGWLMLTVGVVCLWLGARIWPRPTTLTMARMIEERFPDLNHRLITILQPITSEMTAVRRLMERRLVSALVRHDHLHNWSQVLSPQRRWAADLFCAAALCGCLMVAGRVPQSAPPLLTIPSAKSTTETSAESASEWNVEVLPGDVELARGNTLTVSVRFPQLPEEEVYLHYAPQNVGGQPNDQPVGAVQRVELEPTLDEFVFAAQIAHVEHDALYRIEQSSLASRDYSVSIYDPPRLESVDVELIYPSYANMPDEQRDQVRRIAVPEGTQLVLNCRSNVPLSSFEIVGDDELEAEESADPRHWIIRVHAVEDQLVGFTLRDRSGRENGREADFGWSVIPNHPPEFELRFPVGDVEVSPVEELHVDATTTDDFGLVDFGVAVGLDDGPVKEISLNPQQGNPTETIFTAELAHVIDLESRRAKPGQALSYYFYADDVDVDGKPRRACSSLYFADVRPFDEIFRQANAQGGGMPMSAQGGQKPGDLDELLKQQRQILQATWRLIRESRFGPVPSGSAGSEDDEVVSVIKKSQDDVHQQLQKLSAKLKSAEQQAAASAATEAMQAVDQTLETTEDRLERLNRALHHERDAYRWLLKLRSHEHQVAQAQGGGGSGKGKSGRSQQQLSQLELKQKQRYETQQQGRTQNENQQQNQDRLKLLNRLRELGQRQQSINEKLAELNVELQLTKDAQQREEIERQLKSLRDRQQELVRDVDEVRERIDRSKQRQQMTDVRDQAEQVGRNARKMSDALKSGQTSQALGAGRQVERDLQEMSDRLREQLAGRFADDLRRLLQQADQLLAAQHKLEERLQRTIENDKGSLRVGREREQLSDSLQQQQEDLKRLMTAVETTTNAAEDSQPLLSRALYEAIRDTRREQPERNLAAAGKSIDQAEWTAAVPPVRQARNGMQTLRDGIARAAESLLGDHAAALKRARQQVRQAATDLQQELTEHRGAGTDPKDGAASRNEGRTERSPAEGSSPGSDVKQTAGEAQADSGKPADSSAATAQNSNSNGPNKSGGEQKQRTGAAQQNAEGKQANSDQTGTQAGSSPNPSATSPSQTAGRGAGSSQPGGSNGQPGNSPGGQPNPGGSKSSSLMSGGMSAGPGGGQGSPMTGQGFGAWTERLREVEELVEDPEVRARIQQVRQRARSMRAEFVRHAREPNWELVKFEVLEPLIELDVELTRELNRHQLDGDRPPLDRDPVPRIYTEIVKQYYEQLGADDE